MDALTRVLEDGTATLHLHDDVVIVLACLRQKHIALTPGVLVARKLAACLLKIVIILRQVASLVLEHVCAQTAPHAHLVVPLALMLVLARLVPVGLFEYAEARVANAITSSAVSAHLLVHRAVSISTPQRAIIGIALLLLSNVLDGQLALAVRLTLFDLLEGALLDLTNSCPEGVLRDARQVHPELGEVQVIPVKGVRE